MDQTMPISPQKRGFSFFHEAPLYLLFLATFSLPILSRFGTSIPTEYMKSGFLFISTTLALLIYCLSLITKRTVSFIKHPLVWTMSLVLFSALVSALLSGAISKSFFGNGFEIGTFFGLLSLVLVFLFTTMYARSSTRILSFLNILSVSTSLVVLLLLLGRIFGLSFGLEGNSMTLAGVWTGGALLFGIMTLVQGIALELLSLSGIQKKIILTGFILSLAGFIVADFTLAWWVVGVFALIYALYRLFYLKSGEPGPFIKFRLLTPTFVIVLLSIIFIIFGGDRSGLDRLMTKVLPTSLDARPTWVTTLAITKETWKEDPVFGVGPNRFGTALSKNKPADINATPFWGVDFGSGVGYLPTTMVTGGLVGTLAWVIFLITALFYSVRTLFTHDDNSFKRNANILIVFGFLATWTVLLLFVPGTVMIFLAFLFAGLFTASLVGDGDERVISKATDTRTVFGFVAVAFIVLVILGSLTLEYVYASKGRALVAHAHGVSRMAQNDFAGAITFFEKATHSVTYDAYLRSLVDAKIADLTLRINEGMSSEQIQETFSREYPEILMSAEQAVEYDNEDYLNWVTLGTTYQMALSLGIANAYERALADFEQAVRLNPNGPGVYLGIARLELARNNFDAARARLDQALTLKPDYIDALYLHSQIALRTGKTEEAIARAINAAAFSPDNAGLLFQLGLLYYTNENYTEAATVLERAVVLQDDFSNAHYYLGLSYYRLGKKSEARAEFDKLLALNPESALAQGIIENMQDGRDPLYGIELTGSGTVKNTE